MRVARRECGTGQSLTMLILFFILLSSYQPATNSSRGRTRAFFLSERPVRFSSHLGGLGSCRHEPTDNGAGAAGTRKTHRQVVTRR